MAQVNNNNDIKYLTPIAVDVLDAVLLEAAVFLSLGIDCYGSQIFDVVVVVHLCHFSSVLVVQH